MKLQGRISNSFYVLIFHCNFTTLFGVGEKPNNLGYHLLVTISEVSLTHRSQCWFPRGCSMISCWLLTMFRRLSELCCTSTGRERGEKKPWQDSATNNLMLVRHTKSWFLCNYQSLYTAVRCRWSWIHGECMWLAALSAKVVCRQGKKKGREQTISVPEGQFAL